MALFQDSVGTAEDRRAEADRLYKMIREADVSQFSQGEIDFVQSCDPKRNRPITAKMLFWLRDLKDRTL